MVKADTGTIVPLALTDAGALYYMSRADRRNVYRASLDANMNLSGEPEIAVEGFLNSNVGAALSPDGQRLAYYSLRPESLNLVIRTVGSGEERAFPLGRGFGALLNRGGRPHWFPDGRSVLAISRETETAGFGLYRIDTQNGKSELLHRVNQPEATNVALSPDGKSIYHTEPRAEMGQSLVRFDLESRADTDVKPPRRVFSMAVSPDGKWLAYIGGARQPGRPPETFVAVMSAGGDQARELFRGPEWDPQGYGTPAWTPDQRFLVFTKGDITGKTPAVLLRIPVAGGKPEQMMTGGIISPQLQPDGSGLFFTRSETGPVEMWALEKFLPKPPAAR